MQQFTVNFTCNRTIQTDFIVTCCSTDREDNLVFFSQHWFNSKFAFDEKRSEKKTRSKSVLKRKHIENMYISNYPLLPNKTFTNRNCFASYFFVYEFPSDFLFHFVYFFAFCFPLFLFVFTIQFAFDFPLVFAPLCALCTSVCVIVCVALVRISR